MSLAKRISRIKNLENVRPDKRWEKTTKYDLLEEISSQNRLMQAQKLSNTQKIDLFTMRVMNRMAPSMTKALTVFLIFMMFFGVNIAAQASVPGEPLWPVKRSIEEAEISLTFSPVKKTEVHIKHVNERLEEIDKILVEDTSSKPEAKIVKDKAVKQAISHLEKDVVSVDSSLKIVKEEKKAIEVVELVKKVTDATKEVDNKLAEKKIEAQNTNDKELGEALTQAKVLNKQVKKSAVAVAIEIHEETQKTAESNAILKTTKATSTPEGMIETVKVGTLETSTPEMLKTEEQEQADLSEAETIKNLVKEIVASEINDLSAEVKDVKQKVEVVDQKNLEIIKKGALGEVDGDKVITSELDELDVIKKESQEDSEVILQEAKILLDNGLLKDAFEKVSEANEKYQKAEVTLEKISQAIEGNEEIQGAKTQEGLEQQKPVITETPNTNTSTPEIKIEDSEIIKASGVIDVEDSEEEPNIIL